MATTSYLYHAMGLKGYQHLRTEFRGGKIAFHIEMDRGKRTCAECGARAKHLKLDGRFERTFLGLPVGFKLQEVVLHGHLQVCSRCEARVREPIPFADGKNRCLRALGRYLVGMCGITTIKNVATLLGVSWDLVKDLFKADLERRHKRKPLRKVRYLAVEGQGAVEGRGDGHVRGLRQSRQAGLWRHGGHRQRHVPSRRPGQQGDR